MNTLTPLHLEHLDYTLKRLSNALSSTRQREQPPYDMQPLIHCLDILDKGVRRTAAFMTGEWPEPKIIQPQVTLETLSPQSGAEAPVKDVPRSKAELGKDAAKGFFSSLPWEGEVAARADDSTVSTESNPEKSSKTGSATTTSSQGTAAQYFSSLPWQHDGQMPAGKHLLAPESTTDVLRSEAELGKVAAKGFFSSLPWEGEEAASADDNSVSTGSNPEKSSITGSATKEHPQGTAAGYFSSLPWQHEGQTPVGKQLLRPESTHDMPRSETELGKEAAKGFFSSLPWEGEGAARADDSTVSPRLNQEKPSITGSVTTTSSQGTAAQYFSSLPWQHEEQTSRTEERAPLHIQSGASALLGKQSVTATVSNPILAATHSAIKTARAASSDSHADNLPQEDKHGLDQSVEKPTITRRKQNEHSSSDNQPAKKPQAKDDL